MESQVTEEEVGGERVWGGIIPPAIYFNFLFFFKFFVASGLIFPPS